MIPISLRVLFGSAVLAAAASHAGTAPKAPVPDLAVPAVSPWQVTLTPYGWMSGISGTTGVRGYTAETDIPFTDILDNLDMTAMMVLEVQRGRWGAWVDGAYLKMSMGAETPGPIFERLDLTMQQASVEAAVFRRVIDGPRGHLDVYAGARWMSLDAELAFHLDDEGVRDAAEDLSAAVVARVRDELKGQAADARSGAVSALAARVRDGLIDRIGGMPHGGSPALRQLHRLATGDRGLPGRFGRGRLDGAIREYVRAAVAARAAGVKAKAQAALERAERRLADAIEDRIRDAVPDEVSGSKSWVDPFVGVRGRWNLTDRWYLTGKADIGGFGLASDLVWQVYGGIGTRLSEHASMELGYRHMAVDYQDGGFVYDVEISGVMASFIWRF